MVPFLALSLGLTGEIWARWAQNLGFGVPDRRNIDLTEVGPLTPWQTQKGLPYTPNACQIFSTPILVVLEANPNFGPGVTLRSTAGHRSLGD